MDLFGFLLFIALIYGEAQFLIRVAKFPAHLAPIAAMLADTLILYLFAMEDALPAGLIVVIVLSLLMFVGAVVKSRLSATGKWFSLPILAFLVISLGAFLYTRGTMLYIWDEFSNWGVIYRYLMTAQSLPTSRDVSIVTYPPFSPLWQYFVAKIVGFSEANAYFAHILIQFTCIIALFPDEKWKNAKKYLPALLAGILSVFVLGFIFHSLYVDLLMALLMAVVISQCNIHGTNTYANLVTVLLAAVALTLTKPTGIILALVAIACYLVGEIRFGITEGQKGSQRPVWRNPWLLAGVQTLLLFGVVLLIWKGWGNFTKTFDYNQVIIEKQSTPVNQADINPVKPEEYLQNLRQQEIDLRIHIGVLMKPIITRVSLDDIWRAFTLQAPYRTKLIAKNFVDKFSNATIGSSKVTLKWVLVGILILVGLNTLLLKRASRQERNRYLSVNGWLLLGFILYALTLYITYIIIFFPSDAIAVPSLDRYLGTYLLAWGLLNIATSYRISVAPEQHTSQQMGAWIVGIYAVGCLFFLPTQQIIHLPPSPSPLRFEAAQLYEKISQVKFTPKDKIYEVYSVMPEGLAFKHFVLRYYLAPTGSNNEGWALSSNKIENDIYTTNFAPEEWFSILREQGYTYVLVTLSDQEFWDHYQVLFDQYSTDFSQPQLFKVEPDGLKYIPLN